ncbi:uncharacterized protein LOC141911204 [Tubulanus polymorphus]|uniref:uncharacterized protein LOC141911204 n=1 Tax=Tubulanus polymorphus TaxID=672921 RepID=UPI003DA3EBBE
MVAVVSARNRATVGDSCRFSSSPWSERGRRRRGGRSRIVDTADDDDDDDLLHARDQISNPYEDIDDVDALMNRMDGSVAPAQPIAPTVSPATVGATCSICGKSFKYVYNLKRHMKIIHLGIRRYKCLFCSERYGQPIQLQRHLVRVHNVTEDVSVHARLPTNN